MQEDHGAAVIPSKLGEEQNKDFSMEVHTQLCSGFHFKKSC